MTRPAPSQPLTAFTRRTAAWEMRWLMSSCWAVRLTLPDPLVVVRAGITLHAAEPRGTSSRPPPAPGVGGVKGFGLVTTRTRLLPVSATNRSPAELSETPLGWLNSAEPAGPPSPPKPCSPVPAIVEITPAVLTRRMRAPPASEM